MAKVQIGSARSDENSRATGGKAGDQTGREIMIRDWYLSPKGWIVLRPKATAVAAKIAAAMRAACANAKIGYDQAQRNTLYNLAKLVGFDCSKVTAACETDCSALVRVCCAFAGIMASDFTTDTEVTRLMATGAFDKLTADKYTKQPDYLRTGDILVTKTKGHTEVVVNDGDKAGTTTASRPLIKKGANNAHVGYAKTRLIAHGYSTGITAGDPSFGDNTDKMVRAYQKASGLKVDGEIGKNTWAALDKAPATKTYKVVVSGLSAAKAADLADELRRGGMTVTVE